MWDTWILPCRLRYPGPFLAWTSSQLWWGFCCGSGMEVFFTGTFSPLNQTPNLPTPHLNKPLHA